MVARAAVPARTNREEIMRRANVRIRPVDGGDVMDLADLTRSLDLRTGVFSGRPLLNDDVVHLAQRFSEIIEDGSRTLLVAVDESDTVVGMLVARRDEIGAIDPTPALQISHLLVTPKHRRRGIGRMLLTAAVHVAEQQGIDQVLATAASGSREANRYLARLGFAPLVVHRMASTGVLRRSLGMADPSERVAVLRRARIRAGRGTIAARAIGRGA
jgi:ribosomal protein S18 acetylase RimI-like enzyme